MPSNDTLNQINIPIPALTKKVRYF